MLPSERAVIHINVADFAVAVERALDARLRGRPILIAPAGAARACVFDMSEEAYGAGVRKGMALDRARRIVRDAEVLPPHPDRYERAAEALLRRGAAYTPLIEQADENGHLFLDVTGMGRLFGPPPDVAWRIRKAARAELNLDPIWSVAPNKLVAKVASRLVKPRGEYIVEAGDEAEFLAGVPIELLPGLERGELVRLREFHLRRIGDVARLSVEQLEIALGGLARARQLYEAVRGIDRAEVLPAGARRPVVAASHAFPSGSNDAAQVAGALYLLTEQIGMELRERTLAARRVGLRLDYADGVRVVRSATTRAATAYDGRLYGLAQAALQRAWMRRVRVRHLRLVCDRLIFPPAQLELFPDAACETRREEELLRALDTLRKKFGLDAVQVGRTLGIAAEEAKS